MNSPTCAGSGGAAFTDPGLLGGCWEAYLSRLRAACAHVNDNVDVAGLNRELPDRVQKLQELQGDKLRK